MKKIKIILTVCVFTLVFALFRSDALAGCCSNNCYGSCTSSDTSIGSCRLGNFKCGVTTYSNASCLLNQCNHANGYYSYADLGGNTAGYSLATFKCLPCQNDEYCYYIPPDISTQTYTFCRTSDYTCQTTSAEYESPEACAAALSIYYPGESTEACYANSDDCPAACKNTTTMHYCNSSGVCAATSSLYDNNASGISTCNSALATANLEENASWASHGNAGTCYTNSYCDDACAKAKDDTCVSWDCSYASGQCGSAETSGATYTVRPSSGLCDNGTPSAVYSSNGYWTWTCSGTTY